MVAWAWSRGGHWLEPAPAEAAGLVLVLWRLLARVQSHRGHWLTGSGGGRWLGPVPKGVPGWGLLPQRSLAQGYFRHLM